jgi:glucose-6-phosphate isomerase
MLDDLKYIHGRDSADALGVVEKLWYHLEYEFEVTQNPVVANNIVYAGMGECALPALVAQVWPGSALPFEVVRDYDTPSYVSEKTYFIAASYSGNTEETISALAQAEAQGAQIAVIAGGGKLVDIAHEKN